MNVNILTVSLICLLPLGITFSEDRESLSDQAAKEAVFRYLNTGSSPFNPSPYAVKLQGSRAIPFILDAAVSDEFRGDEKYDLLGYALKGMGEEERKEAALALAKILADESVPIKTLRGILRMISNLKESRLIIEDELIELRQSKPELRASVNHALIGIHSHLSGNIFAEILREFPDRRTLWDVSKVGNAARNAGPEVLKLLDHSNWDIRRTAARTLGYIGYAKSTPKLIELLNDPTDVKISWMAAVSLGRIKAESAKTALHSAATDHWHPAVRKAAENALSQIASSKPDKSSYRFNSFPYERVNDADDSAPKTPPYKEESVKRKLYRTKSPEKIEKLAYDSVILGYGANDEAEQRKRKGENAIIVVSENNIVEHRHKIKQVPDVALRVGDGWLVGSDRGEWGGELFFIGDDGLRYKLLDKNIHDLYSLGKKKIAVTGLAHLSFNDGLIYEIQTETDAKWKATPWRALPGAPSSSGKIESGDIFIITHGGGSVILSSDGKFRMAAEK